MNDIKLHQDSKDYMKRIMKDYKEVKEYKPTEGKRIIIHMYAKEDTVDLKTGKLNGFIDALYFEAHVYNVKELTVYKENYCDEISLNDLKCVRTRVFKDGSTMIIIDEPIEFLFGSAMFIYKKEKK